MEMSPPSGVWDERPWWVKDELGGGGGPWAWRRGVKRAVVSTDTHYFSFSFSIFPRAFFSPNIFYSPSDTLLHTLPTAVSSYLISASSKLGSPPVCF